MSEYLFKCKTNDAYVLKILMELLHHTIKLACFEITPKGIFLRMMDSNQKLLIDCKLFSENFTLFYFDEAVENQSIHIGVNLNHLYKMMKTIKKRDSLMFYIKEKNPNDLGIEIIPRDLSRVTISTIKIQNIENLEIELPQKYPYSILVSSNEFCKMCKDMISISSTIQVRAKKFYVGFYSDIHSIFSREVFLGNYQESLDKPEDPFVFDEIFETEHIQRILKVSGLHSHINLTFEKNMPFHVLSKVGTLGEINLYLKSRQQIEEEQFNLL
jgi:proliferating cell nuclear antigen PCNA